MTITYRDFDGAYNIPLFGTIENVVKIDVRENYVNATTRSGTKCKLKFDKLISIDSEDEERSIQS
jgi:hypothetical protein